ncbi:hypothetical protein NLJ89_g1245 [Agrocybe chaxingu]|uniref:Cupin type-2 domain-containing protein n=1 Tax=Agrocybe chaxingu TaxID=84603 RepID=A0A9W8N0F9_9AGAR|nr:hypothetical protein NLJ89_g1245 [Agrocybe chaxingu]
MSDTKYFLPHLRRIVTSHDARGSSVVQSDVEIISETMQIAQGRAASIWITTDSVPTSDNNKEYPSSAIIVQCLMSFSEDGGKRVIEDLSNFKLVHPTGTNLRSTELAPGAITPMHRTSSLDYNILISGELVLITEDGAEKHIKNPGDIVIQKGAMHAWRNPSQEWARWITVLIAADPVIIDEKKLLPEIGHNV